MSPQAQPTHLTYRDYLDFPEDGRRHELIGGEHFVTPAPSIRHQQVSMNLSGLFHAFLKEHPVGTALAAPVDVVLSPADVVQPDLLFVSREHAGIVTDRNVQGAPDLIIEIVSPTTRSRDEGAKLRLYGRAGVREVWLVDAYGEQVRIFRAGGEGLAEVERLSAAEGAALTSPLLPDLEIPLGEVFG